MVLRVILDTNMLLVPGQFKIDIFTELERVIEEPYEIVILQKTFDELQKIEDTGSGEDKRAAKLAKHLIQHNADGKSSSSQAANCKGLKIIKDSSDSYVDDAIVEIAEDDTVVATNDGGLKRRLLEHGVRVIYLKQQQYLTMST
jgi:rRNA-processing protein FCF1